VIVEIFGLPIHGYGLMIVVGFLLSLFVSSRIGRQRGLPDVFYDLGMVMLLCGILGGRTFYYLENYSTQFADEPFWAFFRIWEGGLVFYGGAIGGVLGVLAFLKIRRLPFAPCLDVLSIGTPLGMAFGRLGCFLNGCCFGRRCDADFGLGVEGFPPNTLPYRHQVDHGWIEDGSAMHPIHPVQLYQAAHDCLLFVLLLWFVGRGYAPRGGGIVALWLLYGIGRFFLEGLRGDNAATFSGLTISQNVSLIVLPIFAVLLIFLYWRDLRFRSEPLKN